MVRIQKSEVRSQKSEFRIQNRPSPLPSAGRRTGSSKGEEYRTAEQGILNDEVLGLLRHSIFKIQHSTFNIRNRSGFKWKTWLFPILLCSLIMITSPPLHAQESDDYTVARIKYRGGGDWYNDPSSLKNLIEYARSQTPLSLSPDYQDVALGSRDLFKYPLAFITGHGTISINQSEASNLREYLDSGGFLYVDDDYGLDDSFREMVKTVYPDEELIELPFDHAIYHQVFDFPDGPPKIHEHDNKAPQGFGLFRDGRMVIYYTYESNLADGWANPEVHKNPAALREKALQMGTNILVYALVSGR